MKSLVLVGKVLSPTLRSEIASGVVPRIESLELARTLEADVLDYRDVSQATEPAVVAARIRSPAWGLAVMAALRRDGFEAVYLTGEDIGIPLAFCLRASRCRRRITAVVHNAGALSRRVPFRLLGQGAWDNLICLDAEQRRILVDELRLGPASVYRLAQWVDTEFFAEGQATSARAEGYVFCCGREKRDYRTFREAAATIPHPCWVVASGWSSQPGFRASSGIEATENVRVDRGGLSFSELRDAYDGARFVVVPIEAVDYAAGVTTICEAMAMGKAIIATASPGIAEYVEDEVTGLVVPPGDSQSMARAIDKLWRSPGRCKEMGRHNRRTAETAYSLDRYVSTVARLMSE